MLCSAGCELPACLHNAEGGVPWFQVATCLKWYGDAKKRINGRSSGTKKYTFDWAGRELCWDSKTSILGTDHFCMDTGSGEVLCYFKSLFWPLRKDGKIEISPKVRPLVLRKHLWPPLCISRSGWQFRKWGGMGGECSSRCKISAGMG